MTDCVANSIIQGIVTSLASSLTAWVAIVTIKAHAAKSEKSDKLPKGTSHDSVVK